MALTELTEKQVVKKTNGASSAPVLYKVFAIIEEIAGARSELGISDIAHKLNISERTVTGIIWALKDLGAIRQDGIRKYRLGPAFTQLIKRSGVGVDLRLLARPVIESMSRTYEETIFLCSFYEQKITVIEKADSASGLKVTAAIGTRIPPFAGAAGKVFLSSLEENELKGMLAKPIPLFTINSIADPNEYAKEIRRIRELGYATDFEEYVQGVNTISVPVTDWRGKMVAFLWMVGFTHSLTGEKMRMVAPALKRAAKIISGK